MLSAAASTGMGLHAPLFEKLIAGLPQDRRIVIFDCGSARAGTIALLSEFRCKLVVLNLAQVVDALRSTEEPKSREQLLFERLSVVDDEPAELILCWNLLNYLSADDLALLAGRLASHMRPGARLHALIEHSSPLMPSAPGHWVPDASARLFADQSELEEVPSPRYSPKSIERLMPQFRSQQSILLGNGLREDLLQLRP